jgi:4-hydroxybutyrate CoA-transferase
MDWREEYKRKLVSAEEAVKVVKSGDRVNFGFPRQATLLTAALAARNEELENVEMLIQNPRVDDGWLQPDRKKAFDVTMYYFIGPVMRKWTDARMADYLPIVFSLEPKILRERAQENKGIDVYMSVVSSPDEHGFCSFGANLWNKKTSARAARKVIFEVDSSVIRTYGDNFIHVSEVDYFVEHTPKLISQEDFDELTAGDNPKRRTLLQEIFNYFTPYQRSEHLSYLLKADDATVESYYKIFGLGAIAPRLKDIAEQVKPLIRDGDTIQLGIAGISSYLPHLGVFDDRVDLGYHGEMAARGIGDLIKAGVINGKRKTIHEGKAVFTSIEGFGPEELDFAHENPTIELYDAEYVVNVKTISTNANMVSMNTAISVDLMGQINSEATFGNRMIGGAGGQPESHIGALLSPGGRAITLLRSTALDGAVSCIVPQFDQGAIVTIPRYFADYVVTEYGVARLMGKPVRQRAEELINIAHPDFRSELRKEAQKLFYP